jgi:hypothetical protein
MIFSKGEKIVCIDTDDLDDMLNKLIYGNIYIIEGLIPKEMLPNILNDGILLEGYGGVFSSDRFISLLEFRKQKIKKLISNICQD